MVCIVWNYTSHNKSLKNFCCELGKPVSTSHNKSLKNFCYELDEPVSTSHNNNLKNFCYELDKPVSYVDVFKKIEIYLY